MRFVRLMFRQRHLPWLLGGIAMACGSEAPPREDGDADEVSDSGVDAPEGGARDAAAESDAGADAAVARDAGADQDSGVDRDAAAERDAGDARDSGVTQDAGCDDTDAEAETCGSCGRSCLAGFACFGGGCIDIDECAHANGACDALTTCTNTPGGRECGPCPAGFHGDGELGCSDIDECLTANGGCDPRRSCVNTPGSVECGACAPGYVPEGPSGCADVDECATHNGGCHALRACHNTQGSRSCGDCPAGFENDGSLLCADVNECRTDNGGCDALTPCTNAWGTYSCGACPAGYTGSGATGCQDIDECATRAPCDALATCTNLPGSHSCSECPSGYAKQNPRASCQPILLDIRVESPAYLNPQVNPTTRAYTIGWAVGAVSRRLSFQIASDVSMRLDAAAHDPTQPVELSTGQHVVELTGSLGRRSTYNVWVGTGCQLTVDQELQPNASAAGTRVALSTELAVAGTVSNIRAAQRGPSGFAAASTVITAAEPQAAPPAVAIMDDLVLVGSPAEGRVGVYAPADGWEQVAELLAPEGTHQFGTLLATAGDLLAVGSGDPQGATGAQVSVLRRSTAGFLLEAVLEAPAGFAQFGRAFTWAGERLVVGSANAAHVFAQRDGVWGIQNLLAPAAPDEDYGAALAYDASVDTLFVGAPGNVQRRAELFAVGAVHVHARFSQASPALPTLLFPRTGLSGMAFGGSLASNDGWLVVSTSGGWGTNVDVYALAGEQPAHCFSPMYMGFGPSVAVVSDRFLLGGSLFVQAPYNLVPRVSGAR